MLRFLLATLLLVGCASGRGPELRVVGVNNVLRHEVVFVQVTNPAKRAMRLTKLEYVFATGGTKVSEGEVELAREVPAGQAIVVEVPCEHGDGDRPTQLRGKLTAVLDDEIVRTFSVSAQL